MKKLVNNYTFVPSTRQILINDNLFDSLEQLLLITDVSTNTVIYNFADPNLGGSIDGNTITLDYNTTSLSGTDALQIFIDVDDGSRVDLVALLQSGLAEIVHQLQSIRNDGGMADAAGRVRIAIESGNVGISSNQTVATVTTVSNVASIGGQNAIVGILAQSNMAAQNLRNKIIAS